MKICFVCRLNDEWLPLTGKASLITVQRQGERESLVLYGRFHCIFDCNNYTRGSFITHIGSSVLIFFRHGEMPHEFATVSTRASVTLSHVSGPHRGNNARYIVSSHVQECAAHVPRMTWTWRRACEWRWWMRVYGVCVCVCVRVCVCDNSEVVPCPCNLCVSWKPSWDCSDQFSRHKFTTWTYVATCRSMVYNGLDSLLFGVRTSKGGDGITSNIN